MSLFACRLDCVIVRVLLVTCRVSRVNYRWPPVACPLPMMRVACRVKEYAYRVTRVISRVLRGRDYFSRINVRLLRDGGCVSRVACWMLSAVQRCIYRPIGGD